MCSKLTINSFIKPVETHPMLYYIENKLIANQKQINSQ